MSNSSLPGRFTVPLLGWTAVFAFLAWTVVSSVAAAAPTGKVQGRIVGTDTGEPIGFCDVMLIPADTTLKRTGAQANADGSFLIEVSPGRYAIQIRALSYRTKRVEGLVVVAGQLLPFSTALAPEAIQQEEIVVEARAKQNTENSMLAARKKAAAVGDAVSSEQVRKSADKDAAEVLRRVTGLSVSDGKYVFVRGLGERYSSTEVDGVRLASPEQNKRVVPLDLLPSSLLENIIVQKTYTADRPGEFGGGDVQVRTKDFPGNRTWSYSISQGYADGVTFRQRNTYRATRADIFGFGAQSRRIPQEVFDVAGDRPLVESNDPNRGFTRSQLAMVAGGFSNIWSATQARAIPNASYAVTYGDELELFGHALGVIQSWNLSRTFDQEDDTRRLFTDVTADTVVDYGIRKSTESVQLGGISGLSYRLTPSHALHFRGLYTHDAEDEVRIYEGRNFGQSGLSPNDPYLRLRSTRLTYVERQVLSGTLEGNHDFKRLLGANVIWKWTRSNATRQQPDRRETVYSHAGYVDGNGDVVEYWSAGPVGSREYGDLHDDGWGGTVSGSLPLRMGRLGTGKVVVGFDRQTKKRKNFYRRFNIVHREDADPTASPESVFVDPAYVSEATFDVDNYHANQRVTSGFTSIDVPFGRRVRGNFGVRVEDGVQDVRSFDLFDPSRITAEGQLDNTDWLPSGNLTWAVNDVINVRAAASRTLSRPDLNELSPSATTEFIGWLQIVGNPGLKRAVIENYDLRIEAFPALSEVFAAGFFHKRLHDPIEQAIRGGSPALLIPVNAKGGFNRGFELEARTGLGRLWNRLRPFSINTNASFIRSEIELHAGDSQFGSGKHPLQGQADYLWNGALSYAGPNGRYDATVLLSATGKRLRALGGSQSLPDIYEQPATSLDATLNVVWTRTRLKIAARNLLDPKIQQLQNDKEISGHRAGRTYSLSLSVGS